MNDKWKLTIIYLESLPDKVVSSDIDIEGPVDAATAKAKEIAHSGIFLTEDTSPKIKYLPPARVIEIMIEPNNKVVTP